MAASQTAVWDGPTKVVPMANSMQWREPVLAFLGALLVRSWLILTFPAMYGGDSVIHLKNCDRLLMSHQLPVLLWILFLIYRFTEHPLAFRFGMAVLGAIATTGFFLLAELLSGSRRAAFWGALFFATNPFLNEISIVPFQEIVMVGALCFAMYFYLREQWVAASVMLGVACLTRYEAWILCPILAADFWYRRRTVQSVAVGVAAFDWAP